MEGIAIFGDKKLFPIKEHKALLIRYEPDQKDALKESYSKKQKKRRKLDVLKELGEDYAHKPLVTIDAQENIELCWRNLPREKKDEVVSQLRHGGWTAKIIAVNLHYSYNSAKNYLQIIQGIGAAFFIQFINVALLLACFAASVFYEKQAPFFAWGGIAACVWLLWSVRVILEREKHGLFFNCPLTILFLRSLPECRQNSPSPDKFSGELPSSPRERDSENPLILKMEETNDDDK